MGLGEATKTGEKHPGTCGASEPGQLGWATIHSLCIAGINLVARKFGGWGDKLSISAGDIRWQSPCRQPAGASRP